jgi:hypothetical protein
MPQHSQCLSLSLSSTNYIPLTFLLQGGSRLCRYRLFIFDVQSTVPIGGGAAVNSKKNDGQGGTPATTTTMRDRVPARHGSPSMTREAST